jgi:hypothetical protein
MKDYLAYLQADPRYGKMFEPVTRASVGRLADAIHYAGYSDDPLLSFPLFPFVEGMAPTALPVEGATLAPLIAPRILGAAKDPIMKRALWQYRHWPPDHTAP